MKNKDIKKVKIEDIPHNDGDFNSIMIVGDPHLHFLDVGKQFGKRFDNVTQTGLFKLQQTAILSQKEKAFTIITGDLFNKAYKVVNSEFLSQVVNVLSGFYHKPVVLTGNHEKSNQDVTDRDLLNLLSNLNLIDVIDSNEIYCTLMIDNEKILIGGTSYSQCIPNSLEAFITDKKHDFFAPLENKPTKEQHTRLKALFNVDKVMWITHHDFIFNGGFFGDYGIPMQPIKGVDYVINGHLHKEYIPEKIGNTVYYNFGNIMRLKISDQEHIPSVNFYKPNLSYTKEYFGEDVELFQKSILIFEDKEKVFPTLIQYNKDEQLSSFVNLSFANDDVWFGNIDNQTDEALFIQDKINKMKNNKRFSGKENIFIYIENKLTETIEHTLNTK